MIKDINIVSAGEERGQIWTGMPTWVWANCLLQVHQYTGTLKFLGRLGLFLNSRNLRKRKDLVSSRDKLSGKVLDLVTPWNGVAAGRRRWERSFGRIGRREIFQYSEGLEKYSQIWSELRWEGWGSGWLDTSGCYTHRTMGRMCACYSGIVWTNANCFSFDFSDKCNRGEILGSRKHLPWLIVLFSGMM